MDIKQQGGKKEAPTPNNTPHNATPIQQGGKKNVAPTPNNTPHNSAPIQQQQQGKKGGKDQQNQQNQQQAQKEKDQPKEQKESKAVIPAGLQSLIQDKLSSLAPGPNEALEALPLPLRRRVAALKNLQDQHNELEAKFREEILALEAKYLELYKPNYSKRHDIILGKKEPTDEEVSRDDIAPELLGTVKQEEESKGGKGKGGKGKDAKQQQQQQQSKPKEAEIKGIPEFWATALKNHPLINQTIEEHDIELLNHLEDIQIKYIENNLAFVLEFYFSANQFFTNQVLTKTYRLQNSVGSAYDDVVYASAEGSKIDWKQGKDITVRVETKKQRNKASKKTRVVKKIVPQKSFFRFFSPPTLPGDKAEDDEEEEGDEELQQIEEEIEMDFEIGEVIKSKIVPYAVDWFTGEALEYEDGYLDDEYDDEEFDEEEDGDEPRRIEGDDDDDEDDDDDDDDGSAPAQAVKPGEKPAECQQN